MPDSRAFRLCGQHATRQISDKSKSQWRLLGNGTDESKTDGMSEWPQPAVISCAGICPSPSCAAHTKHIQSWYFSDLRVISDPLSLAGTTLMETSTTPWRLRFSRGKQLSIWWRQKDVCFISASISCWSYPHLWARSHCFFLRQVFLSIASKVSSRKLEAPGRSV